MFLAPNAVPRPNGPRRAERETCVGSLTKSQPPDTPQLPGWVAFTSGEIPACVTAKWPVMREALSWHYGGNRAVTTWNKPAASQEVASCSGGHLEDLPWVSLGFRL